MVDDRRMNVTLTGNLPEEIECFSYLGSFVAVDGGMDEVKLRMNKGGKTCGE